MVTILLFPFIPIDGNHSYYHESVSEIRVDFGRESTVVRVCFRGSLWCFYSENYALCAALGLARPLAHRGAGAP